MHLIGVAESGSPDLGQNHRKYLIDYADATLVTLAENAAISQIVTLDRKDFSIYRLPGRKAFHILP